MFKKTQEPQLNMFSSPSSILSGKSQKIYDDKASWHNMFRRHVTTQIDESPFGALYCNNNGTPNSSIRVLIAMMVLKEAEGLSDQKIFEDCRFNMLTRSAVGLLNADDAVPADSTYYLLRKRIADHEKAGNGNLLDVVFAQVTKKQCIDFEVSGKRIRMDSKLLGSNIAWLTRYEPVHETFRLFYNEVKQSGRIDGATTEMLDGLLKMEGNKITYTCPSEEVKTRLQQLGALIHNILPLFSAADATHYQTLKRVFDEQFVVDENKMVAGREKEEITAQSVQSPHDTDCTYRNKDGDKVKGYSINITESCDDGEVLNLIGHVDVRNASTSDLEFLQDDIKKVEEVFTSKVEAAHADGAYHSPENQDFCKEGDREIELHLHAIQGAKGRYNLELVDGKLSVLDTATNELVDCAETANKEGLVKWRIKTENGHRYFTQKDIDTCLVRKKIAETPIEVLQKRNNVEASIFQLAYHFPNAKSRYRGLIKHKMWANARCLWVNFVRIMNFKGETCLAPSLFAKNPVVAECISCFYALQDFVMGIFSNRYGKSQKIYFLSI
jgi:Transposase domain (DUF772)